MSITKSDKFFCVFVYVLAFTYKTAEWTRPQHNLAVFQEPYPNKVIYRCAFNRGYLQRCYGSESIARIGSNTVSCAGVSIGDRDAILVYVSSTYLL